MQRLSYSDIIRRRRVNSVRLSTGKESICQDKNAILITNFNEDEIIQEILDRFKKQETQSPQTLHKLIEIMASKSRLKFNKNIAVDNIKFIKQDHVGVIESPKGKFMRSYYVLKGQIIVYSQKQNTPNTKSVKNLYLSEMDKSTVRDQPIQQSVIQYPSIDSFETDNGTLRIVQRVGEHKGYGYLFNSVQIDVRCLVVSVDAVIGVLDNSYVQEDLLNLGEITTNQKQNLLKKFKIFDCLRNSIRSYLPVFSLRKYYRGQAIYQTGDKPQNIHLILKGEVLMQAKISINTTSPQPTLIPTETLGIINYFGEEQLLFPSNRKLTAKCKSVECWLLQLALQRVEKLIENSDFAEAITKAARIKIIQRSSKMQKSAQVWAMFNNNAQRELQGAQDPSNNQIKIKHRNVIKRCKPIPKTEQVRNFSMLKLNMDMYNATLKKSRKQRPKYIPDTNWDLQRVWKVLNLENVLSDKVDNLSSQGRKFYDIHQRLASQLNETKSLRPKTSSSNYRTRLKYITYLQQFNS